jgi:hypothetical protein
MASVGTDTGELQEKRLAHREDAEKFYRGLASAGQKVRVGMEASGHARWFERLVASCSSSCGLEMRRKSARSEYASRRPIVRMRD